MTMQTTAKSLCALAAFAAGLAAFAVDPSNAVLRLLNSRASGSPRAYAEAAEEVAAQAMEDLEKKKTVSILGAPVRRQVALVKHLPVDMVMDIWCKQQGFE